MNRGSLRVLVADDQALARQRMVRLLSSLPGVEIVAECTNGSEVLHHLQQADERPDVLLLDIRMPELSGLEARALLADDAPYVIFATAYSEHALEAFDVGADDYLLKPIEASRLKRALERAATRLKLGRSEARAERFDRIFVQTSKGVVLVLPGELSHAEFSGGLVTLSTTKGDILADFSLRELHDRLPDQRFWRVHRRALLNLDFVERLEAIESGGYTAHMRSGAQLPVSRQVARRLRRELGLPG